MTYILVRKDGPYGHYEVGYFVGAQISFVHVFVGTFKCKNMGAQKLLKHMTHSSYVGEVRAKGHIFELVVWTHIFTFGCTHMFAGHHMNGPIFTFEIFV